MFPVRRAVAGHCPKKCSTVSSDSLQLGHILVRDGVQMFVESIVNGA